MKEDPAHLGGVLLVFLQCRHDDHSRVIAVGPNGELAAPAACVQRLRRGVGLHECRGTEAENQNHHPNWSNVYNRVEVELSTHDAGNVVTEKDRKLAAIIDKLV